MITRDTVLPVDPDTAYELVRDDEWVDGAERVFEEDVPGERVVWWWDDEAPARVEVVLSPVEAGTRITVTETPTGPLCLA